MTPTIVVLSLVLLLSVVVMLVLAWWTSRSMSGGQDLQRRTARLTETEQRMRALTESALAPRPAWLVRIMVEGHRLPAIACYRVPVGFARDPREAVNYVRRRHRHAREGYPDARWLAFPVVGEERQQRSVAGTA